MLELDRAILWLMLAGSLAALPYFVYLLIVSLAALLQRRVTAGNPNHQSRFLVVIPAHDEEAGIGCTIRSCLALDYPRDRFEVVVIADNCTDRTAELARLEGAVVIERSHPSERSKGHALRFLFDRLVESGQFERIDAVVIIDADSVADSDLLQGFAARLEQGHDWIQAFDTVANRDDSWRTRLMAYSFGLINGVLLKGQTALGLSAGFRGNGMCFSTRGLRRFPWKTHGLVEDLEYSWSLRAAGEHIAFAPEVAVHATMLAQGGEAARTQRSRWESGRSQLKRAMLNPLIKSKQLGLVKKLASVIELTLPTLAALAVGISGSLLFCAYCMVRHGAWTHDRPFLFLLALTALEASSLAIYGMAPFFLFGLDWRVLLSLIHFPGYVLWKLSMLFRAKPSQWVRTERAPGIEGGSSHRPGSGGDPTNRSSRVTLP
jgi:cellulose synthase/poly-beta-1,6-N-acetylglucosamine synthase-like glycosyltransferase